MKSLVPMIQHLLDEDGLTDLVYLEKLRVSLAPSDLEVSSALDHQRFRHIMDCLNKLSQDRYLRSQLEGFRGPITHPYARNLVRLSCELEPDATLNDTHLRRAMLSCWFTWLRQSVGSCFATAPAVLVQTQQPWQLLEDCYGLLITGRLKRVVDQHEMTVPLGSTTHTGTPPTDHPWSHQPLLKAWEYTIASLAACSSNIANWNFYASLGMNPKEEGGIGAGIFDSLQVALDQINREIERLATDINEQTNQINDLVPFINSPGNSSEQSQRLMKEFKHRKQMVDSRREDLDQLQSKAKQLSTSFQNIIDFYLQRFGDFFQEVYDPNMEITRQEGITDDNPAGFRLMHKHGHYHNAQWTTINDSQQFIDALESFFRTTEYELMRLRSLDGLQRSLDTILNGVLRQLRSPEFMLTALQRMTKGHGGKLPEDPLNNMDKVDKKPWMYTSGSCMETTMRNYWQRPQGFTSKEFYPEDVLDLLVQLLNNLILLPQGIKKILKSEPHGGILVRSQDHAFNILHGSQPFASGWHSEISPRHWLKSRITPHPEAYLSRNRDKIIPAKIFVADPRYQHSEKLATEVDKILDRGTEPLRLKHLQGLNKKITPKLSDYLAACVWSWLRTQTTGDYDPLKPIVFADSNWHQGYLAAVLNPLSTKWQMWLLDFDSGAAEALSHGLGWFGPESPHNRGWCIYPRVDEYRF